MPRSRSPVRMQPLRIRVPEEYGPALDAIAEEMIDAGPSGLRGGSIDDLLDSTGDYNISELIRRLLCKADPRIAEAQKEFEKGLAA